MFHVFMLAVIRVILEKAFTMKTRKKKMMMMSWQHNRCESFDFLLNAIYIYITF